MVSAELLQAASKDTKAVVTREMKRPVTGGVVDLQGCAGIDEGLHHAELELDDLVSVDGNPIGVSWALDENMYRCVAILILNVWGCIVLERRRSSIVGLNAMIAS